ncbi:MULTISPECIES: MoaD/ThiS family protein [Pseudonocardia]|uniref:ThiS family protein n=2 Tax=Pseudonocardia TaxID=1847 RepID=A0A1Y2N9H3_PSEAH|nr:MULTISPECIES: MoaD/ThiS family protein [Pseudonocardia]OSY44114.1 ThiS family protein [Pseudonocardia autotrophica]TDN74156.1 molybdopterin converting factor small subunit [Pseudonocardia autotrophica]BBG04916.1 molybdopterin synthase sulfur carrier subunit [Pseudonocardia autotrophica]GEC23572.1 molybdopterin synthase sulfur carrier subunit [Pseudonocardia saturnea]
MTTGIDSRTGTGIATRTLTVRYFAAAKAAAGTAEEIVELGSGATVADAVDLLRSAHGPELGTVLDRCSFLLDEFAVRDRSTVLRDASVLDVLPPFAGG